VAALIEARDRGLVRFIGITGHARPEILGHALTQYRFDTVLVALGIIDRLVTSPETFLLPRARENNTGVIAMKVFGHGKVADRKSAFNYSLALPGVSLAIIGLDNEKQIDEAIALAIDFEQLSDAGREQLVEKVRPVIEKDGKEWRQGKSELFWLHDTSVSGWTQKDEPALVDY
jgi:predicted aldo/keto reductase-like oxidoreductase